MKNLLNDFNNMPVTPKAKPSGQKLDLNHQFTTFENQTYDDSGRWSNDIGIQINQAFSRYIGFKRKQTRRMHQKKETVGAVSIQSTVQNKRSIKI